MKWVWALLLVALVSFAVPAAAKPRFPFPKTSDQIGQNDRDLSDDIRAALNPLNISSGTVVSFTAISASFTNVTIGNVVGNLNMNGFKVTNLASGTANGDAIRFEQWNQGRTLQAVDTSTNSSLSQKTTTSASYASTGLSRSITISSNTSRVRVIATESFGVSGTAGTVCTARVLRSGASLAGPSDFYLAVNDSTTEFDVTATVIANDSPGVGTFVYGVSFARSAGGGTCITNSTIGAVGGNGGFMLIEEIGQ